MKTSSPQLQFCGLDMEIEVVRTYRNIEAVRRAPREAGLSIPSIAKKMVMAIIEKIWGYK